MLIAELFREANELPSGQQIKSSARRISPLAERDEDVLFWRFFSVVSAIAVGMVTGLRWLLYSA